MSLYPGNSISWHSTNDAINKIISYYDRKYVRSKSIYQIKIELLRLRLADKKGTE